MIKHNGEQWYEAPPLYKRIRKWFFWIGGWEKANCKGWRFSINSERPRQLTSSEKEKVKCMSHEERLQFAKTIPKENHRIWLDPFPMSFLGHRITFYSWGMNLKVKEGYLYLIWSKNEGRKCYISSNGTPWGAHIWYWGTPKEILKEIEQYSGQLNNKETRAKTKKSVL